MPDSDDEHGDSSVQSRFTWFLPDQKTPIIWDGNDASLPGVLDAVKDCWVENDWFQDYIAHHAAPTSGGRLAFDHIQSVHFYKGTYSDICTFDAPAAPTPARLTAVVPARTASRTKPSRPWTA